MQPAGFARSGRFPSEFALPPVPKSCPLSASVATQPVAYWQQNHSIVEW
jgi:hypothetical protein